MRLRAAVFALLAAIGCGGPAHDASTATDDIVLPGVDISEFTPRERHEFSEYVRQLPSPCKDVAVPVAECVLEKRACAACPRAAWAIAKAVRDGFSREQVEDFYKRRFDPSGEARISVEGSPSRGPADARVVLVEFADFECPFCQRLAPQLDSLWEERRDKVRFVYKFMPLEMHAHSEIAARAAIAAQAQGKFWEMHHLLFANGQHLEQPDLEKYASSIGLDMDRFRADMRSPATQARLDADKKLANDVGVHQTPTVFVDGREQEPTIDIGKWLDDEIAARK
jgi:hypothetical protein